MSDPHRAQLVVFDVDGPLSDPVEKRITRGDVLPAILELRDRGWTVALNTGRAWTAVERMVLHPWRTGPSAGRVPAFCDELVVACEKGAVLRTTTDGRERIECEHRLRVDPLLGHEVARIVAAEFSQEMFVDPEKLTMLSVEMTAALKGGIERYTEAQQRFLSRLRPVVNRWHDRPVPEGLRLHIDPSVIAVDVELRGPDGASKALGARRIAQTMQGRGMRVARAVCVGDGPSDLEMSHELARTPGVEEVRHFHVGPHPLTAEGAVPVEASPDPYEAGTAWVLARLLGRSHAHGRGPVLR